MGWRRRARFGNTTRWLAVLAVPLLLLPGSEASAAPYGTHYFERLTFAPADCWPCERGSLAGTRSAHTKPIVGDLDTIWTYDAKRQGEVAWSPLVWGQVVWVTLKSAPNRYHIQPLRLHDGSPITKAITVSSDTHPQPSIWNNRVAYRRGGKEIRIAELVDGKIRNRWRMQAKDDRGFDVEHFEYPILFEGSLYVRQAGEVVEYLPPSREPRVHLHTRTHGRYAIGVQGVMALSLSDNEDPYLLTRGNSISPSIRLLHRRSHAYISPNRAEVVALADSVSVYFAAVVSRREGMAFQGKAILNGTRLDQRRINGAIYQTTRTGVIYDIPFRAAPVVARQEVIVQTQTRKGEALLLRGERKPQTPIVTGGLVLAKPKLHAEFLGERPKMSAARDVVYVGHRAFRATDGEVLWEGDFELSMAPIPAKERLLVVDKAGVLHALAPASAAERSGVTFRAKDAPKSKVAVAKGLVLLADGRTHEGAYEFFPEDGHIEVIGRKDRRTKHERALVRLLLDDAGKILYAESIADAPRALARHLEREQLGELRDVAKLAYKANDRKMLARLLVECERAGMSDKRLGLLRKMHAGLVTRSPKLKEDAQAKALAEEVKLRAARSAVIGKALGGFLEDERPEVQLVALRQILLDDPDSKLGRAALEARLPPFLTNLAAADPVAWVDLAVALQGRPLTQVKSGEGEAGATLLRLRDAWRPDITGLMSERLFIATSVKHPQAISRCIVLGELVCDALEHVFHQEGRKPRKGAPMVMQLFANREGYLSLAKSPIERKFLEKSTGHYDPATGHTRLYLPEGNAAWAKAMRTYAHEIAHQWIAQRCPQFAPNEIRRAPTVSGFWIVEGMADLLADFEWDLEMRTFRTKNRRARSLDVVANTPASQHIPWADLFRYTQRDFAGLDNGRFVQLPLRWRLGRTVNLSRTNLFYSQSAAMCHYLFHHSTQTRKALIDYLAAHYKGELKEPSLQKFFGMSAAELGGKAAAYAVKHGG